MTRGVSTAAGTPRPGADHRGLLVVDRADLVAIAAPMVAGALADRRRVVVVVDRATARELADVLADGSATARPTLTGVEFAPPSALDRHGSAAFTRSLNEWAGSERAGSERAGLDDCGPDDPRHDRTEARPFVLTQYVPGTPDEEAGARAVLDAPNGPPVTVICACASDAEPSVLAEFRRGHRLLASPGPPAGAPALRTTVGDTEALAGVRREVRRVATAAGFGGSDLDRAVLAVHEAAVLGYRLACRAADHADGDGDAKGRLGSPDTAGRATGSTPCRLEVRTGEGRLVVDVVVPTGGHRPDDDAATGSARADGPAEPEDLDEPPDDLLGRVRPDGTVDVDHVGRFCHAVSVHDRTRSRAIRVLALAAG